MNDVLETLYRTAFAAMKVKGPGPLAKRVALEVAAEDLDAVLATDETLLQALEPPVGNSGLAEAFRTELHLWDAAHGPEWADSTAPLSRARRDLLLDRLGLSDLVRARLEELFPAATQAAVVISEEFEPWYPASLTERRPFYWEHYRDHLLAGHWPAESVANLGLNADRVVERLSDPERAKAFQAKGLVVGYVQSGKTANFTGVISKAIDAGYRLIIVLTGTTNLLREQTQRRLDKELVGKENLLKGINRRDEKALANVDYYGDEDWDEFVEHGALPSMLGKPDIRRLTRRDSDYRELLVGIESLDLPRVDLNKPFNDPVNLRPAPVRLAVLKKNVGVLEDILSDLDKLQVDVGEVPALLIDDESDQASVNTVNPDPKKRTKAQQAADQERTAINDAISRLLGKLPRCQYVGYTATPFANVFTDPSDVEDIFPKDFIVSLERPPGYMGASDFHDLEVLEDEDRTPEASNEAAFVRRFVVDHDDDTKHLRDALDTFVLTGAVKRWRMAADPELSFRHHTMLVHEAVRQASHKALAETLEKLWWSAGYSAKRGRDRLRALWEGDLQPVMAARHEKDVPCPSTFGELLDHVARVVSDVSGADKRPIWIVNSDKEMAEPNLDFGSREVWKVLVGGTKLARGFTIEGLTVSYYRRATRQMDTLMQMGRWFGFREGYRDLVRLYIDKPSAAAPKSAVDVYLGFEAACRAEEAFREELERYSVLVEGKPQVTPKDIPPLVVQHLPWLRPAAKNKMFNVELVERRSPGIPLEPTAYPADTSAAEKNATTMLPVLRALNTPAQFLQRNDKPFDALYGVIDHGTLVLVLQQLTWDPLAHFAPDLEWLAKLTEAQVSDWALVVPQLRGQVQLRDVSGLPAPVSIHVRERRAGRETFGALSDDKHRRPPELIALPGVPSPDVVAESLRRPLRGAGLIYPVWDAQVRSKTVPSKVALTDLVFAFRLLAPRTTATRDGRLVRFRAKSSKKPDKPVIKASEAD